MHVANKIYKDMAVMTKEQSEVVEIIHFDLETAEDRVK
jgi:t-SNARE complex subunit (syntaxin)